VIHYSCYTIALLMSSKNRLLWYYCAECPVVGWISALYFCLLSIFWSCALRSAERVCASSRISLLLTI